MASLNLLPPLCAVPGWWQFNRLFIGPSFGLRIGLSLGPSVKMKRSCVQTARIGPAFTQWGTFFATRIPDSVGTKHGPRIGPSFGPRF